MNAVVIRKPSASKRGAPRRKPKPDKPLWEKIVERGKRIPPEELANFPADGARNLDHYLYVAPKQELD